MPDLYQFGSEHYLYLGLDESDAANPKPQALTGRIATDTVHFNNANWSQYDNIRDLDESQDNNNVNITTREEARQGLSANVIATTEAGMTFEIRYKPNESVTGDILDKLYRALVVAARTKADIAAVDLDRRIDKKGAQGQVGNWNVALSRSKPVEGLVVANITFSLSGLGDWIVNTATDGSTTFARMDDDGDIVAQDPGT